MIVYILFPNRKALAVSLCSHLHHLLRSLPFVTHSLSWLLLFLLLLCFAYSCRRVSSRSHVFTGCDKTQPPPESSPVSHAITTFFIHYGSNRQRDMSRTRVIMCCWREETSQEGEKLLSWTGATLFFTSTGFWSVLPWAVSQWRCSPCRRGCGYVKAKWSVLSMPCSFLAQQASYHRISSSRDV